MNNTITEIKNSRRNQQNKRGRKMYKWAGRHNYGTHSCKEKGMQRN